MKKLLILMVGIAGFSIFANSDDTNRKVQVMSDIGPAYATSAVSPYTITLAAPGAGLKNCLEYVVWQSSNIYNLSVLDNTTTNYMILSVPANQYTPANFVNANWCTGTAEPTHRHHSQFDRGGYAGACQLQGIR